jgi:hypothetical protein
MSVDKLYFKDLNEGCFEEKIEYYCDCEGNEYCITTKEPLPYKQAHEILPPVYIPTTWGADRFYESKITESLYVKNSSYFYIHTKYAFKVGDIFKSNKCDNLLYYIKRYMGRDRFFSYIYQIKQVDNLAFRQEDFLNLKKNNKIIYRGYYIDKNQDK